ncbi:Indole-diterpene biosynthesis protein [Curvularia clavata]|uniref:Indole-diterpene biosynthesis protein n=1 Tax=Curvularia clavata TaxID=95742 RepID=A0A9Q8ZHI9_CURCL|nr:Indole-diterpene biosynthesis protein [Curvularia clavata]
MLPFVLTFIKRFAPAKSPPNTATAKVKVPHNSIPGCRAIAPTIWEYVRPSTLDSSEDSSSPCLIMLMTWTGAYGQHISKYISKYAAIYPTSRILVITTSAKDIIWRSPVGKRERLLPAVNYILNLYGMPRSRRGGILLHLFSEGGANKGCELAIAYRAITGSQLPISAICMDSTPGHPRFLRLCSALAKSFPPKPILKQFATLIAIAALGVVWAVYHIFKGRVRALDAYALKTYLGPIQPHTLSELWMETDDLDFNLKLCDEIDYTIVSEALEELNILNYDLKAELLKYMSNERRKLIVETWSWQQMLDELSKLDEWQRNDDHNWPNGIADRRVKTGQLPQHYQPIMNECVVCKRLHSNWETIYGFNCNMHSGCETHAMEDTYCNICGI